jgi:hypothetical protein
MVDLDLVWVNFFGVLGQLYSGGDMMETPDEI